MSVAPWSRRPQWLPEVDRPQPLLYLINGGEANTKLMRAKAK
jgi:L-fucose isomerase